MGLSAVNLSPDAYIGSGDFNQVVIPSAIHSTLSKKQLEQRYPLYRGSGGSYSFTTPATGSKIQVKQYFKNKKPADIAKKTTKQGPQNKLASVVDDICTTFGLTKEELAQVCHVQSRKTLYNWIDGKANPRKSAMRRIFELLTAAKAWRHAGFSNDRTQLRLAVLDGQNLFEILNQEKIDMDLILFLGSRLNMMSPIQGAISDPFA